MLRSVLSAVFLVVFLVAAGPVLADQSAVTAPDTVQAASHPAASAAAGRASDAAAPGASVGFGKTVAPAGFGWS
jgi:hypothetical protein